MLVVDIIPNAETRTFDLFVTRLVGWLVGWLIGAYCEKMPTK